jgi:HAE1 family hydrophobic/amphiphilic exporter-1
MNFLKDKKKDLKKIIFTAGIKRLRPVLITTLTTIFGMIPLVLMKGEGAEVWRPFGITVIGGLSFSTIITLIFIPILYSVFYSREFKREKLKNKKL